MCILKLQVYAAENSSVQKQLSFDSELVTFFHADENKSYSNLILKLYNLNPLPTRCMDVKCILIAKHAN